MQWFTLAQAFPDLAEPVDIVEVCTKVVAFLAVCVGAVLALKLGMAVLDGVMSWFGVVRNRILEIEANLQADYWERLEEEDRQRSRSDELYEGYDERSGPLFS